MKNEKIVDFEFWDFIERFHPAKKDYPFQKEMCEIRTFLTDNSLMNTEEGSKLVCKVLAEHGSAYGALAYLKYLESELFVQAFKEYFCTK